jgi:iron complex outermembrane receptor protein
MKKIFISAVFFVFNQIVTPNLAIAETESAGFALGDLPSLDLDELLAADVQVTSAMKRLQNMSDTAASIYVLTNKEIMQSGVTSVAQALKLIPGMQVRQLDNNQWAITSRSTAGRYSSKLLVMIDGQSIYNPLFAGVYWEALNIPLYDIERIEVIRGQGGLLWGSNATNGVVNIISKHTADTRSTLAQVTAGTLIDHKVNFRIGGDLGNYSSFRVFAGFEETDESSLNELSSAGNDDSKKKCVGGRVDLQLNEDLSLLAQTQYNHIEMGQTLDMADLSTYQTIYPQDQSKREHLQVMTRLDHRLSSVSNQMLQAAISSQKGEQLYSKEHFVITDLDYQMNTLVNGIQFDWGLNGRYSDLSVENTEYTSSLDDINSYHQFGGFVQAQFNIIPDKLKLIWGDRSEKNSFTGWEHQPMGRLLWKPHTSHTLWAAVSQGVRIPSLIEYNGTTRANSVDVGSFYPTGIDAIDSLIVKAEIIGSSDIEAEKSLSKELGYRYTANSWGLDLALFHTKAKDVLFVDPDFDSDTLAQIAALIAAGDYATASNLISSSTFTYNFISGAELTTYGGEATIKWQPFEQLTAELGYSFTSYQYHDLPAGTKSAIGYDSYLRHTIAKINYALTPQHSLFAAYRIEDGDAYATDDFSVLDLSWNWQITPLVKFSLTGNNLLYGKHLEYNNTTETYTVPSYIEKSYLAKVTVEF